jgi:hypothetical protein
MLGKHSTTELPNAYFLRILHQNYLYYCLVKDLKKYISYCLNQNQYVIILPFFFSVLGFWTQNLILSRQMLYHLSHIPSPCCFSCFSDQVLSFLQGPAMDHDPPILGLLCSRGCSYVPLCLACLLKWGLANFLPRLASNNIPHLSAGITSVSLCTQPHHNTFT